MTLVAGLLAMLRGPVARVFAAVPRPLWYVLAALLAALFLWRWHDGKVMAARTEGARVQAMADRAEVARASAAATAAQAALAARLARQQTLISKGTDDALRRQTDDLARRYDDLRLRWAAHRAAEGGTGNGDPAFVPDAAARPDAAACASEGWVSFETAAATAEAADRAIAKDDAWIAWATAQQAAWPK